MPWYRRDGAPIPSLRTGDPPGSPRLPAPGCCSAGPSVPPRPSGAPSSPEPRDPRTPEPGPSGPLCHRSPGLRRRPREAPTPQQSSAPGRTLSPASPERQQGCSPGPGPRGSTSINAPWHYPAPSAPCDGAATPGNSVCAGLRLRPCPALLQAAWSVGHFLPRRPGCGVCARSHPLQPPAGAAGWMSCRMLGEWQSGGGSYRAQSPAPPHSPTGVFHRKAKLSSFTEVKKKHFNVTEVDGNVGPGRLWMLHPGGAAPQPHTPLRAVRPSAPLQPGCVHLPPSAPGAPGGVGVAVGVLAADAHPPHALLQAHLLLALHESVNLQREVWSRPGEGHWDHRRR